MIFALPCIEVVRWHDITTGHDIMTITIAAIINVDTIGNLNVWVWHLLNEISNSISILTLVMLNKTISQFGAVFYIVYLLFSWQQSCTHNLQYLDSCDCSSVQHHLLQVQFRRQLVPRWPREVVSRRQNQRQWMPSQVKTRNSRQLRRRSQCNGEICLLISTLWSRLWKFRFAIDFCCVLFPMQVF